MATTFIWKVASLKTNPNDDNYITEATAKVFGTEGSVTKATTVSCIFPGNKATVGSDFKSLDDLKKEDGESIIVGWIKVGIMDYKVAKIEKTIQNMIDIHNKKVLELTVNAADTSYSAQPTETTTPEE
jgi:hypothetical protein